MAKNDYRSLRNEHDANQALVASAKPKPDPFAAHAQALKTTGVVPPQMGKMKPPAP